MKKKLLMGVFGLGLMLSVVGVQAETIDTAEGTASADITVWNVDTPVYNVEIEWDNLSYNWVYDDVTETYSWQHNACTVVPEEVKNNLTDEDVFNEIYSYSIYTSRDCASENSAYSKGLSFEEVSTNIDNYFYKPPQGSGLPMITIVDNSEKTSVIPSIEWSSSENYDWTLGKFYSEYRCAEVLEEDFSDLISSEQKIYSDSKCSLQLEDKGVSWKDDSYYYFARDYMDLLDEDEVTNGDILEQFRYNDMYQLYFVLGTAENEEIKTPQIGDTIGTITISIK